MPLPSVSEFVKRKSGAPLSMTTCYDYPSARLVAQSRIDCVLVGDSVAMVVHGHASTLAADVAMLELHTAAVARGLGGRLLVADMPFLSFRQGIAAAVEAAGRLVRAGAQAVKLEGVSGHEDVVRHLIESGIPVMGHVGLTPQHVLAFGGFRVQGREPEAAGRIRADALKLVELGVFGIVLEGVPTSLAEEITRLVSVPTIGIGAGPHTDGQVLVWHDLMGLHSDLSPRFVRNFGGLSHPSVAALDRFAQAVAERSFPSSEESYP
jgi:3-methyl-2-oxobutanoate hydroxymethyltransferase